MICSKCLRKFLLIDRIRTFKEFCAGFLKEMKSKSTYWKLSLMVLDNRTIMQLARDYVDQYPDLLIRSSTSARVLLEYILSGSNTFASSRINWSSITWWFELRKWTANNSGLLSHIHDSYTQIDPVLLHIDSDFSIKIKGLQLNPSSDSFPFRATPVAQCWIKRIFIGNISYSWFPRFFIPTTLVLKLMVQSLWSLAVSWDNSVPQSVSNSWT